MRLALRPHQTHHNHSRARTIKLRTKAKIRTRARVAVVKTLRAAPVPIRNHSDETMAITATTTTITTEMRGWGLVLHVSNLETEKTEANKIRGCQSQVWFVAEQRDGRLHFRAISDAAIVSGLIAMLLRIYSDKPATEILESSADFVAALELEQHLSPTRSNGLAAMLKAIRRFAEDAVQAA